MSNWAKKLDAKAQYTELAECVPTGSARYMTDDEALDWICSEFGFDRSKITILHDIEGQEINSFLKFMGWNDLILKALKMQKETFCEESRELTKEEYKRLVKAAEGDGNRRLSLVIQTICATGIRVSELRSITVEAARIGKTEIFNKGKHRVIFLPSKLRRALSGYIKDRGLASGPVFVTRTGRPLDRSNIWRDMKALCESAGVEPGKVFPHNLRHLFARTYYNLEKDLSRLADILGHTSVNTTRIYTMESGAVHASQIEQLRLFVT